MFCSSQVIFNPGARCLRHFSWCAEFLMKWKTIGRALYAMMQMILPATPKVLQSSQREHVNEEEKKMCRHIFDIRHQKQNIRYIEPEQVSEYTV